MTFPSAVAGWRGRLRLALLFRRQDTPVSLMQIVLREDKGKQHFLKGEVMSPIASREGIRVQWYSLSLILLLHSSCHQIVL